MQICMDEWVEMELSAAPVVVAMPVDQVFAAYWLRIEGRSKVQVALSADPEDRSAPVELVGPSAELRIRRGEVCLSSDRKQKVRVKVSTRAGRE